MILESRRDHRFPPRERHHLPGGGMVRSVRLGAAPGGVARRVGSSTAALVLALVAIPARGGAAPCDGLTGEQKRVVLELVARTRPYDCCDETLDRCLRRKRVCRLSRRLRDQICRLARAGRTPKQIADSLARRARSMTVLGARRASISLAGAEPAGSGRVKVVVYACSRCPFCAKVLP